MPSSCISSSKAQARSASTGACPRPPWSVMAPTRVSCKPKPTVEGEREGERKEMRCHFFYYRNRTSFAAFRSHKTHHGQKRVHCGRPIRAESRGPRARGQISLAGRRAHSREMSPVRAVVTPSLFLLIVSWHIDSVTYIHVLLRLELCSACRSTCEPPGPNRLHSPLPAHPISL